MQDEIRKLIGLDNPGASPIEVLNALGVYLHNEGIQVEATGPLLVIWPDGHTVDGRLILEVCGLAWGHLGGKRCLHIHHGLVGTPSRRKGEPGPPLPKIYEEGDFLDMRHIPIDELLPFRGNEWLPDALLKTSLELIERLARSARLQAEDLGNMRKKLVDALSSTEQD